MKRSIFGIYQLNEIVGAVVLACIGVFIAVLINAGLLKDWFQPSFTLRILLPDEGVSGLAPGAEVQVLGTRAGEIRRIVIDPNQRSKGLSWILYGLTCFALFLRQGMRPLWISSVTQVPSVYGIVVENFSDVYPGRADARATFEHTLLARQIMASHRKAFGVGPEAEFDEARFVIINAYTGGSDDLKKRFEDAPKHRNAAFNEVMQRELNYDRGDDFLQIGQVSG